MVSYLLGVIEIITLSLQCKYEHTKELNDYVDTNPPFFQATLPWHPLASLWMSLDTSAY